MADLKPKKVGENEYRIDADSSLGMKVPVTIYASEVLLEKMMTDRTIKQAVNVKCTKIWKIQINNTLSTTPNSNVIFGNYTDLPSSYI